MSVFKDRHKLECQKRKEQNEILKDHDAKWLKIWAELHERCAKETGHSFIYPPDPRFRTPESKRFCNKCGKVE